MPTGLIHSSKKNKKLTNMANIHFLVRRRTASLSRLQQLGRQAIPHLASTRSLAARFLTQAQIRTFTGHGRTVDPQDTANFIDNKFLPSNAKAWYNVHDPATNHVVTRVPQTTQAELKAAVKSAQEAFPTWKTTSLLTRQSIMFNFVSLIKENKERLAESITLEQGKTFADAKGDVLRGLQVAETACGITTQLTGDVLPVAKDMETRSIREPLGVVAAICPFSTHIYSPQFQFDVD